jgi:hypothetical protein
MKLGRHWLFVVSMGLLLIAQTAHADFRRALDAYIVRDGDTMLKEVKDAVDKKNDDGLILFLNALAIDYSGSKRLDKNIHTSTIKSTYEQILNDCQQEKMRKFLDIATSNSTAMSQWILLAHPNFSYSLRPVWWEWQQSAQIMETIKTKDAESKFSEASSKWGALYREELNKIASNGSAGAASALFYLNQNDFKNGYIEWMKKSAELGDPEMAISMGFKYLNWSSDQYYSDAGCDEEYNKINCLSYDQAKAMTWLQKATDYIAKRPMYFSGFMREMGDYELSIHKNKKSNPKQAYLWYLWGINSLTNAGNDFGTEEMFLKRLQKMKDAGQLALVAPQLDSVWSDSNQRNSILHPLVIVDYPDLASKTKNESKVLFEYIRPGNGLYSLTVYKNGEVKLHFFSNGNWSQTNEIFMKKSPKEIENFINELEKLNVYDWTISSPYYGKDQICRDGGIDGCLSSNFLVSLNTEKFNKIIIMSQHREKIVDMKKAQNISALSDLVEKHFPTKKLRCEISSSKNFNTQCAVELKINSRK